MTQKHHHVSNPGNWRNALNRASSSTALWTIAFLLMILALNADLFTVPLSETSDHAVNSLQVQQARHFSLLVGHYSRFHFHHPGPAYLYIFAFGEFLFHNILHLVPAPFNGQIVMTIVLNVGLLGATISIFQRQCRGRFPVPLALAATLLVAVMVNHNSTPSMLISNWMPDVLLFAFLLFVVSGASVLTGATRDLPLFAVSGMLLIHAHIAQFLFVGLIGLGTVVGVCWPPFRQNSLTQFLHARRWHFGLAAAILFLFALPPVLDILLHKPNNLDDVLAYVRKPANHNSVVTGIRYLFCFLTFVAKPESLLSDPSSGIVRNMLSDPWIVMYWAAFGIIASITAVLVYKDVKRPPTLPFLKYLSGVGVAAALLFVYWGMRITGDLFAFNGRFFFAVHLLACFMMFAVLSRYLTGSRRSVLTVLALVFIVTLAVRERSMLRPSLAHIPDAVSAAAAVRVSQAGKLELVFAPEDWPSAAALANAMWRLGKPFCVTETWAFMFSRENVCSNEWQSDKLLVTQGEPECSPPCQLVHRGGAFSVTYRPAQLSLPIEIGFPDSVFARTTGFNTSEATYRSTQKHAAIRFLLTPAIPAVECLQLEITGFVYPGRTTQIVLNGNPLGSLTRPEPVTALFAISRKALQWGSVNTVSFETANTSSDVDPAFGFMSLAIRTNGPGDSCSPLSQPTYRPLAASPEAAHYDFNGDGHADLVWQLPGSSLNRLWFLGGYQGVTQLGEASLPDLAGSHIVAVADFNGDGHPDLVWQDTISGRVTIWFMTGPDGTQRLGESTIAAAQSWRIVGAADFNRDGHPDLLWQDPVSGRAQIWYLGGTQGAQFLGAADLTRVSHWRIAGAADFNHDGRPDLLWQDPVSGATQVWYLGGLKGNEVVDTVPLAGPNAWHIVSIIDLNLDRHPDIVWQDSVTGSSQVWFLGGSQGTTQLGTSALSGPTRWQIAGPR